MTPLGLPVGSVRAILAFALVAASIALTFLGMLSGDKLFELAVVVVAFYFGTRPAPDAKA